VAMREVFGTLGNEIEYRLTPLLFTLLFGQGSHQIPHPLDYLLMEGEVP